MFVFVLYLEPQSHKRRGFKIRKKSSSHSESGSPPSPKLFSSLEQLSLSVESSDVPSRGTAFVHPHSGSHAADAGTRLFPVTPKSNRRFSVLGPLSHRPSASVPNSPKLGFSNISIPLWSPCRSLFHHHHQPSSEKLGTKTCTSSTTTTSGAGGASSSQNTNTGAPVNNSRTKGMASFLSSTSPTTFHGLGSTALSSSSSPRVLSKLSTNMATTTGESGFEPACSSPKKGKSSTSPCSSKSTFKSLNNVTSHVA